MLDSVIVETAKNPDKAVIWLHGLGGDGHDFEPIVAQLKLPADLRIRFIFPHAPQRSVTVNGGYIMRAWYDIANPDILAGEDDAGIRQSGKEIFQIIDEQKKKGIPAANIVLAGFSQGGAMTLFSGLRYPEKLAGLMALSAYLPLSKTLKAEMSPANAKTPVFIAHGRQDQVVPFQGGQVSKTYLAQLGLPVEWHEYNMTHAVNYEEVADIAAWIQKILNPKH